MSDKIRELVSRTVVELLFDDGIEFDGCATPAEAADANWQDYCEYHDRIIAALDHAGFEVARKITHDRQP